MYVVYLICKYFNFFFVFKYMMLICDVRIVDVLGIKLNLLFQNKGKENVII